MTTCRLRLTSNTARQMVAPVTERVVKLVGRFQDLATCMLSSFSVTQTRGLDVEVRPLVNTNRPLGMLGPLR